MPDEHRQGIRNYVVGNVIRISSSEDLVKKEKVYLHKLNVVLVQILKQDWPTNWPSFIPEIVASSRTNVSLCENNMIILKLLSEEIFDFSAEEMNSKKAVALQTQLNSEFAEIFRLCQEVLDGASKVSLIQATLATLQRFIHWVPESYYFQSALLSQLVSKFFPHPTFRNLVLQCFTEVAQVDFSPTSKQAYASAFSEIMSGVKRFIPLEADFAEVFENGTDEDQKLIENIGVCLTTFFSRQLPLLEASCDATLVVLGHEFLVKVSTVRDREVFRTCLDYWHELVKTLYEQLCGMHPSLGVFDQGQTAFATSNHSQRLTMYAASLSKLRLLFIESMMRPEEVLVTINDEGEVVKEVLKELDTIVIVKAMKDVLVYLTHLDQEDMTRIMEEKLARQMDGSEWSVEAINKLCWSIGAISGSMMEEDEKKFLVYIIRDLLTLTEQKQGKDNKAIVASCIMYIVGQYPRFLRAHWKFLKTVVNKLFEFMHETHEGVQEMACETFMKIVKSCRKQFVVQQTQEVMPFIEEILHNFKSITSDLQAAHLISFHESLGIVITAQTDRARADRLIETLMTFSNEHWDLLTSRALNNPAELRDSSTTKALGNVLKTNVAVCGAVGPIFERQLGRLFMPMLGVYRCVSGIIKEEVATRGAIAPKTPLVRALRTIKKEILKLLDVFVSKCQDLPVVTNSMLPGILAAVLSDYKDSVNDARDAEVLNVMTTVVSRLGNEFTEQFPAVWDNLFDCTLGMITQNFEDYPDIRRAFFDFLKASNSFCFPSLLKLPPNEFKLFYDSIVWAFKHTMRDIAELGLVIFEELIFNMVEKTDAEVMNVFFQTYLTTMVQDVFYVLVDTSHKSGFKYQAQILSQLFGLVAMNKMQMPLYDVSQNPGISSNAEYLKQHVVQLLETAFDHVGSVRIKTFVQGLFDLHSNMDEFKRHLRDFLIDLKEFQNTDNSDLYLEDKEKALLAQQKAERDARANIPGLLKPEESSME